MLQHRASGPTTKGFRDPLDVQDQAGGEECKNNSVASLSEQVCLGPKDFLNDWLEWEESDNDSETIDDRDIKERSLKDYDFISLYNHVDACNVKN